MCEGAILWHKLTVVLRVKSKVARVADLKKSPTPPGRVQSFCTAVHTVAQSAKRSAHTPGGAGVMGVVGMLIGPAGLTGGEAATGLGREGLVVLPGTAGGVVVGLTPTGTAGVAPGVVGAEVAGVASGEAGLPGELVEIGLPGALGVAGLPGPFVKTGLPWALGVAGLPGTLVETGLPVALGVAGLPEVGDAVVGLLLGLGLVLA